MKKNKLFIAVFFAVSVFFQIYHFRFSDIFYEYGFAVGIDKNVKQFDLAISLIYVLMPLIFIIFFSSGEIYNMLDGYEKILVIRNYSKRRLFFKKCLNKFVVIAFAVLFQIVAYSFFNNYFAKINATAVKSVLLYLFTLYLIIIIQGIMEMYVTPYVAAIILIIYCYVSYFTIQMFFCERIAKILLFPSLMFGMQNDSLSSNGKYYFYLTVVLTLTALSIVFGTHKFKKIDIFWGGLWLK